MWFINRWIFLIKYLMTYFKSFRKKIKFRVRNNMCFSVCSKFVKFWTFLVCFKFIKFWTFCEEKQEVKARVTTECIKISFIIFISQFFKIKMRINHSNWNIHKRFSFGFRTYSIIFVIRPKVDSLFLNFWILYQMNKKNVLEWILKQIKK